MTSVLSKFYVESLSEFFPYFQVPKFILKGKRLLIKVRRDDFFKLFDV